MAVTITQYPSILTDIITATNSSSFYFFIGYAIALIVAYKACRCVIKDYQGFLALGPGGTPYNFAGYLKITYLRIYTLKDPFQPPSLAEACNPTSGYLHRLPRRAGSRPRVIGIAPHRQIEQSCSTQLHDAIRGACHTFAAENAGRVETGSSCFEKHGLALFLTSSSPIIAANIRSLPAPGHLNATCAGEICHLHSFDSSMHMTLHPIDAAMVIASGWGERHPLAGCNVHGKRMVPSGFVMVYTPTNVNDIATVMEIVKAAVGTFGTFGFKAPGKETLTWNITLGVVGWGC